jgi:hypothetical protein
MNAIGEDNAPFPTLIGLVLVTVAALVLGGLSWWLVPIAFGPVDSLNIMIGSCTLLVWALSVVTVLALAIATPFGLMPFMAAFFAGMGLRMIGVLVGAALLAHAGWFPSGKPLAMALAILYLPLLMLEVGLIALFLKKRHYVLGPQATGPAELAAEASA